MRSMVPGKAYDIEITLPADHTRGTYWYHPHHHGSADVQVASGMAGAIIVEGDFADVPEITEACWGILGKSPDSVMCASSRMVVKFKGAAHPTVIACTLLPYDPRFDLGPSLAGALGRVSLNHSHCAKFCVLGGGACSGV